MSSIDTLPFVGKNTALPASLVSLQDQALSVLESAAVPSRRHEDWKYSARKIGDLSDLNKASAATDSVIERPYTCDAIVIRVENGQLSTELGDLDLPQGLTLKSFTDLSTDELALLGDAAAAERKTHEFEQVNQASFDSGLFIAAATNAQIDTPVIVECVHSQGGVSMPRIFVHAGANSQLSVVEEYYYQGGGEASLCISHSDYLVSQNAQINSLRMNLGFAEQKLIASTRAQLKRDARFNSDALCLGAELGRHDLRVLLQEPGAECDLNGVVVTKASQHFDNHTSIEHIAPHCTSNENYRCIADDKSQIVFNGRIHILRDAQKTLGAMSNKNLLLSSSAEIDSKPELEIYADDVKCAHGTTIGQLDEEEVYYLKTRGLSDEQARQMLTLGFVLEIVRSARIEQVAEFWERQLAELLSFQD